MSNDYEGLAQLMTEVKEETVQFFLVLRVKTARRLISKDDLRTVYQSAGYGYALLLAS